MIEKEVVRALAQERIDELNDGIFIVEITITPNNFILVELDKTSGGVAINDCVSVSRNIEHNLDRDVEDFELSVSSAGMDRPLRVKQQYEKNLGRLVQVIQKDGVSIEGNLTAYTEEGLTVSSEKKVKLEGAKKKELITEINNILFSDIKEVKRVITFK
jgi:ribosome maturation factor RimP